MDMELLRYFPTSKMQQATLLALWMTVEAHLMRTKTCTGKVNELKRVVSPIFCVTLNSQKTYYSVCFIDHLIGQWTYELLMWFGRSKL